VTADDDTAEELDVELDSDPDRVDVDAVWAFLDTEAYWARWRTREDFQTQLHSAWRVVGAYDRQSGQLMGFARAVSDGLSVAYLADVFVIPAARGSGLGKAIVDHMIEEGPGRDLLWMLHTADAHGLYAQFGFAPPNSRYLERPSRQ
jgi:GNAT superfamily N-acetyltransferase